MDGWILGTLGTSPSAGKPKDDRFAVHSGSTKIRKALAEGGETSHPRFWRALAKSGGRFSRKAMNASLASGEAINLM
jgi:hypothetical protein